MSWISGNCQGDRRYECYYMSFDGTQSWCRDSDSYCFSIDDGGGLVKVVDHEAESDGW